MQSLPSRWFGAGHSVASDSAEAGAEATRAALDGRTPVAVLVFASVAHDLPALLAAVRAEAGRDAVISGCTTLGEISPAGPSHRGVAVSAFGGEGFTVRTRVAQIGSDGHRLAGARVADAMTAMDRPHSVLILLCDGVSGNPHEVVRGAYSVAGAGVPMVGGFAGDDREFRRTYQFHGAAGSGSVDLLDGAVVGIALGSEQPLGIGIAHGWRRIEPPMIVTRGSGGRIQEIDGRPALEVLAGRVGVEATDDAVFGGRVHAIGLSRRSGEDVRILHSADESDGSVLSGAEVGQGALFWLMEADHEALVEGARMSCAEAIDGLGGAPLLGALAFDCGGRAARLGEDGMVEEVAAIGTALGGAPFAGLYTLGEVARVRGATGMHSLTLVTLAMA